MRDRIETASGRIDAAHYRTRHRHRLRRHGGWRSIFWTLAIIGLLAVVATVRIVPESLAPDARRKSSALSAIVTYADLLRQGRFSAYALSGSFTMAGLFVYIGASAFIFIDYYGLSPTVYSLVFAGIAFGAIAIGYVNIRLLNRWREYEILPIGLLLHGLCVVLLVAVLLAGFTGLRLVGPLIFLALISQSLIFGNVTALVMDSAPGDSGSASSLFGVMQYVFAGVVGGILGLAHDGTLIPPALIMLICAAGAIAAWRIASRAHPAPRTYPAE